MTNTPSKYNSEIRFPSTPEECTKEAIAHIKTLFPLADRGSKLTANQNAAALSAAIHALEAELLINQNGGISHLLQLAQADKDGLLLRLPCPEGTPYYRLERDCPQCSHYDGYGIGDIYCSISEDSANHEFDSVLVAGCPMRFTVEEYKFDLTYFTPKHWDAEFGKSIFLDPMQAQAKVDELNRQRGI